LERMDGVLDLMLEKEAENDPKEYFKVSDAHKDSVSSKNGAKHNMPVNEG